MRNVGNNYFGFCNIEIGIGSFFRFTIGFAYKLLNRWGSKKSLNRGQIMTAMKRLGFASAICVDVQRWQKVLV